MNMYYLHELFLHYLCLFVLLMRIDLNKQKDSKMQIIPISLRIFADFKYSSMGSFSYCYIDANHIMILNGKSRYIV